MLGQLKIVRLLCYTNNLHLIANNNCSKNKFLQLRTITLGQKENVPGKENITQKEREKEKEKKKIIEGTKIKIIKDDGSVIITKPENALRLARQYNHYLVKTQEVDKSSRLIYKLVSTPNIDGNEIMKDETKSKGAKSKTFIISTNITKNDLNTKLNNINKVLKKNNIVIIRVDIMKDILYNQEKQNDTVELIKKNVEGVLSKVIENKMYTMLTFLPLQEKSTDMEKSEIKKV